MKKIFLINLLILLMYSCSNHTEQSIDKKTQALEPCDTLIGKLNITNEIAGSAYRKRATRYFLTIGKDTSSFRPIFSESNENVWLNLNLSYKPTKSYEQRLRELALILPVATSEYNIDSLKSIFFGRLILSGDLAIQVTQEYLQKFGDREHITTKDYAKISEFILEESSFVKDLNQILKPYSKRVSDIGIEKAFFTNKDILMKYSKVSKDTTLIPEKIIDFMLWVNVN